MVVLGLLQILGLPHDAGKVALVTMSAGVPGVFEISVVCVTAGKEPLRGFLLKHSAPSERGFFLKTAQRVADPNRVQTMTDRDFIVVIPAFVVRELSLAFQIGFLIFLPFLVIDLVISNILLAMGMMMLSPTTISLPFKLLLFVMVDGWILIARGLVLGYS